MFPCVCGLMWCFQIPGFEALILAELQKQQQSNHFCDTLLKADGVSVPAHSYVLSAVSPQLSSSLSSAPAATGHARLLDFGSLGPCTLLHLVRLLYTGKMFGEGEKEKQEAISAAAKLGINGLIDVSNTDSQLRKPQDNCLYMEVGVQTESQTLDEHQVRLGGWRREVRDGATLLWRERLPMHGTEMWTQTEDIQMSCASSSQPPVSYETIDLNALQSLSHASSLQIPYVPMTVVCPNEGERNSGLSSVSTAMPSPAIHCSSVQTNVFPISSQALPYSMETSQCGPEVRAVAMEEWPEEEFEQFEGNIPGFINYFLNPEKDGYSNRRQGRGRPAARVAATGTRGRTRGRRVRLTETVDVQDVGVSNRSKMYLQRWGMYVNRTGQGGGAVGRKLYVKTREFVRSGRCTRKAKGYSMDWNMDLYTNTQMKTEARTRGQRGRPRKRGNTQQQQPNSVQRGRKITKVPRAQGPEEQSEQIDHLLEEVMMGLDIIPHNNKKSKVFSNTSCRGTAAVCPVQNQRRHASVMNMGLSSSEELVLQQPQEGELADILDQFLHSFERLETSGTPTPGMPTQSGTSESYSPKPHNQYSTSHSVKNSSSTKRPRRRKKNKREKKSKKTTVSEALDTEEMKLQASRQLQQTAVVKLERRGALPETVKVQELRQSAVPKAKRSPSNTVLSGTKCYPIRSRFREAQIMNTDFYLENPLSARVNKRKCCKKVPDSFLPPGGSSLSAVDKQRSNGEDQNGPAIKESNTGGLKRHWDLDVNREVELKRICLNLPESVSLTTGVEEVIDVETVLLNTISNTQLTINTETIDQESNVVEEDSSDTDAESSDIDVDSDLCGLTKEDMVHAEVISSPNMVTERRESEHLDDEIDVTGGTSPVPAPVLITWTDSSESDGDSEIDFSEEQTVILSKGRLVRY